jgi:nucleoside-diphosphate-sugar epimerase
MIVGKGDIASILNDREGAIFFAAGVSKSTEIKESEFMREIELLDKQDKTKCLFYFSTIALDDVNKNNQYHAHKRRMELLIKSNFENYNIIRIGNITWGSNPNTFINYIKNKIKNGEPVEIKDEYKYMIDKEQLVLLTDNLPLIGQNQISVFGRMAKVKEFRIAEIKREILNSSKLKSYFAENPNDLKMAMRSMLSDDMGEEANVAFDWAIRIMESYDSSLEQN